MKILARPCQGHPCFMPMPPLPDDMYEIAQKAARLSRKGNFAVVSFKAIEQQDGAKPLPVLRGQAADFTFNGLRAVPCRTYYGTTLQEIKRTGE